RAGDHVLSDREPAAGAAVVRIVGELRAGERERESADVCRADHAGDREHAGAVGAVLGVGVPPERAPGVQATVGGGPGAVPEGSGWDDAERPAADAGP